jgi:hypothetical protein
MSHLNRLRLASEATERAAYHVEQAFRYALPEQRPGLKRLHAAQASVAASFRLAYEEEQRRYQPNEREAASL